MSLSTKVKMSPLKGQEMDKLLEMSAKELTRLDVMQRLSRKQMSQTEAGTILKLSTRQVKRPYSEISVYDFPEHLS